MKKYIKIIAFASLTLLAANACVKEELTDGSEINSDLLSFSATTGIGWNNNGSSTTKSATYVGDMELTDDEGNSINVSMSVLDGIESGLDQTAETKGTQINSTNFTTQVSDIGVYGFLEKTSQAYMGGSPFTVPGAVELTKSSTTHDNATYSTHWTTAGIYYWPKAVNLDFWAWAPKATIDAAATNTTDTGVAISNFSISNSSSAQNITFTYTLGPGDTDTTTGTNATAMPDLMFAYKLGANKDNVSAGAAGCVPLDLKHALAAVQFKVVSTKGGKVNSIKLVDVAQTGTCVFSGGSFAWTRTTDNATYGHDFATTLTANTASDFYSTTGGHGDANFMMIPQDLGTQKVSISFSPDANSAPVIYTGTIPSSTAVNKWEAGKTYVYTINIDDNTNVTITDQVSSANVKSNVVIRNTGNTKAYLRVAIIGNWCDGKGKIIDEQWTGIGTWTATTPRSGDVATSDALSHFRIQSGSTLIKIDIGNGWVRDGNYFYYIYQVPAGQETVGKLFTSYEPTRPTKLPAGAHLEMSIAVQAVQANLLLNPDGTFKGNDTNNAYRWNTTYLSTLVDADDDIHFPYTL